MENPLEARLAENLCDVRRRIGAAAERAGRDPNEVRLVAVAKGQSAESIRVAYGLGLRDIGENRVEEALPKQGALSDLGDICWHMVGHVQSRKAERVARAFRFVQSIDRAKVAHLLSHECILQGRTMSALMECNVSGEITKYGWALSRREDWPQAFEEIGELIGLPGLDICGLMTMAPWTHDTNLTRSVFRTLRELRDRLSDAFPGRFRELSMGMTDDFEIAVEEGATIVRIGRALFGERSA